MIENNAKAYISFISNLSFELPEDIFFVENDKDYVAACEKFEKFEPASGTLKIWVRSRNHFIWLKSFTEQINFPAVFEEKTAASLLAEKWNVILPQWLTEDIIIEQDLLNLDVPGAKNRVDITDLLLTHFFGSPFKPDIFDPNFLPDIIKTLTGDEARLKFKEFPVLKHMLKTKCEKWAGNSSEPWTRKLCTYITEDTYSLWKWLSLWACLHGYPEKLLEYVLPPDRILFVRSVPFKLLYGMPLESTAREQALTQIELLLKRIRAQIDTSDEFKKVVNWTSGLMYQEYKFVSDILKSHPFTVTQMDIKLVQSKFQYCPEVNDRDLKSLTYCVVPARPRLIGPNENWESADWISWATKEYTPYRTWQIYNNAYDEDLEKTVVRFSEWYIEEYASIHMDKNLSLAYCLERLPFNDAENELVIVLLIDCLPLEFFNIFDDALRHAGCSRHELQYRFAALPTSTAYNKPVLISGQWQPEKGDYESLLKVRSKADWNNRQLDYLRNLKELSDFTAPVESSIVFLNFLDGDELLHSDVESKNSSYETELYRYFERIADSILRITNEWPGQKENIGIYVVTDHGACRILDQEKSTLDSSVISKLFPDEKHRFAVIEEKQRTQIPENLWLLGNKFKLPFESGDKIYFLPKGHNTVKKSGKHAGYMHGGVTPEEVIVPTALYRFIKSSWKQPAARFLNMDIDNETGRAKFYIQRVLTVEIDLNNPNPVAIKILEASVLSPETDLKSCDVSIVPAEGVNTIRLSCYFQKAAMGDKSLEIRVLYEISGEQHAISLSLESEFRSAMSGGLNLREL